ncbi:uncharacterized protein LOC108094803 [Drosophila ficusphila]|uniref:uncharacterized protein LOC108094803 n=1 Tax=Drosophila ficusphila TaxID=30025 RepID=UPI0007E81A66|nr:uncharacterized protein LOC108094803 [Drosophila ficusphila]
MGLKRFVSSIMRKSPIKASEPGKLVAGCPSVFSEDGTWSAKFQHQKPLPLSIPSEGMSQGHIYKQPSSSLKDTNDPTAFKLSRKRSWLLRRTVPS